jgi:hypothetical protein
MKKIVIIALAACFLQCHDDGPLPGNCALEPNTGPCNAAIPRYYFDAADKKCKEFIWGGCNGVVPFETLEACKLECGCQ